MQGAWGGCDPSGSCQWGGRTCWVKLWGMGRGVPAQRGVRGSPGSTRGSVTLWESRLTEEILGRVLLVIRILGEVVDFLAHSSEGSWEDTSQETLKPLCAGRSAAGCAARGRQGSSPGAARAPLGMGLSATPNAALSPQGQFGPWLLLHPPSAARPLQGGCTFTSQTKSCHSHHC